MDLKLCTLYVRDCSVCQVLVSSSHCYLFMYFALFYVLIIRAALLTARFMLLVWLCMFVFCVVCSVFLYCLCIVSPFVYSSFFTICVQFYRPPPPGGNSTTVNKYHIISKQIKSYSGEPFSLGIKRVHLHSFDL